MGLPWNLAQAGALLGFMGWWVIDDAEGSPATIEGQPGAQAVCACVCVHVCVCVQVGTHGDFQRRPPNQPGRTE